MLVLWCYVGGRCHGLWGRQDGAMQLDAVTWIEGSTMVAVVDVDKSRINSPSSSLPKSSGEDKCDPLPPRRQSPSIHLNAGEAMERRPRRSYLLVSSELPHDAGETNGATNSARIPFSSPAYCASMQSKRRGSELGSGSPPRLRHTAPQCGWIARQLQAWRWDRRGCPPCLRRFAAPSPSNLENLVIGSPFACISRLKAWGKGNKKCVGVFENEMESEMVSRILKNRKWNREVTTVRCDPWWRTRAL